MSRIWVRQFLASTGTYNTYWSSMSILQRPLGALVRRVEWTVAVARGGGAKVGWRTRAEK